MSPKKDEFIERRIVTGLIVSTDFVSEVYKIWNPEFLESITAVLLASWCLDYYENYHQAPGKDIEGIYSSKLKEGSVQEEQAESIETILAGLSDEYSREQFNVPYLLDQTREHFQEQKLKKHIKEIRTELLGGSITEAEKLACSYLPIISEEYKAVNPFTISAERIKKAFAQREQPLINFPKALGEFWNDQLVRDSFIALLGAEKKGKTFMLMEIAMRAMSSGCHVAFFQAGDMSEEQQLMRFWIYLAKRSDKEKYCRGMYVPVVDCKLNQINNCNKKDRECGVGVLEQDKALKYDDLTALYHNNPDYKPCRNCQEMKGTPWLQWHPGTQPLTWKDAYKKGRDWQNKHKKEFKLCTYANETLSIMEIKALLRIWERQEGFVPDVIVIDYADILAPDPDFKRLDFRHQQNKTWQRLRALSQTQHCLVVTATQAASRSYDKESLKLSDFSEDKRKYAHVTAMYGLNQKPEEKKIGLMRLNALVVRDDNFIISDQVTILQRLQMGRPFLGSYR